MADFETWDQLENGKGIRGKLRMKMKACDDLTSSNMVREDLCRSLVGNTPENIDCPQHPGFLPAKYM